DALTGELPEAIPAVGQGQLPKHGPPEERGGRPRLLRNNTPLLFVLRLPRSQTAGGSAQTAAQSRSDPPLPPPPTASRATPAPCRARSTWASWPSCRTSSTR